MLALAAAYALSGRLGLMLDAVGGFATLVWAPTGMSIAALLLFGRRYWPGVALGAFAVNLWTGAPIAVAAGIAVGNTLEAVIATAALRRIPGFRTSLDRIQDAIGLILLAAGLSTAVSATIGVASLYLGGVIPRDLVAVTWGAWWLGDAIGALVVAPLLLSWGSPRQPDSSPYRPLELVLLSVVLLGASVWIFSGQGPGEVFAFLQPYVLAPPLIWAALRFDTRITTAAVFVIGAIAVWATALGRGPFDSELLIERLRALQAFMSLVAPTLLVLAAVAADQRRAEAALRRARDAAEEASVAKSRFLAVMSHELRTPLTGIVGYAELMRANIGGELSARHREYNDRLLRSASYLISLIEGILTFSRAEAGRDEPHFENVDLRQLVRESVMVVEVIAAERNIAFRVDDRLENATIRTDPGKVRQILLNLLGNAIKFSRDSPVDVVIAPRFEGIDITVADRGVGIPESEVERIFEPFTQLDDAGRATHGGTGLGLSVSRTFARLLGGDIVVRSRPGAGSSFTLTLPYSVDPAPPPEQRGSLPS